MPISTQKTGKLGNWGENGKFFVLIFLKTSEIPSLTSNYQAETRAKLNAMSGTEFSLGKEQKVKFVAKINFCSKFQLHTGILQISQYPNPPPSFLELGN